jgi:hypothetical protein
VKWTINVRMIGDGVDEFPSPGRRGGLTKHVRLRTATKIAAIPVIVALLMLSSSSGPKPLDHHVPEARDVAEAFATAMIETGWDEARAYLSSSGPDEEQVDLSHDFFVAHEFVIVGHAHFADEVGLLSGHGYQVPVQGLEGIRDLEDTDLIEWTIGVELVEEGGSWKVFGYDYTAARRSTQNRLWSEASSASRRTLRGRGRLERHPCSLEEQLAMHCCIPSKPVRSTLVVGLSPT